MGSSFWIGTLVAVVAVVAVIAVVGMAQLGLLRALRLGRKRVSREAVKAPGEFANTQAHAEPPQPKSVDHDRFILGGSRGGHDARPPAPTAAIPPPRPAPGAGAAPPASSSKNDRVEASALVPRSVARSEVFRIEVVLARRGGLTRALASFSAGRDDLLSASPRELTATLAHGAVLELTAECAQADLIKPRLQRLRWTGQPVSAGFQLRPAADLVGRNLYVDINVFIDRVCVGHLPLTLPLTELATPADTAPAPAAAAFEIPRRLFMSYTSADRAQVLPIARALKQIGVETFVDRLSLEGGEDWEPRLWREIDACDCFMLFWSKESAASIWVQRETLRALERQRSASLRRPKIVTHLLGKPPPAVPPPALASLHFNDPAYALWEAATAAGDA